eukprot:437563-Pelagomonas_calceolata.AAC.2
MAHLVCAVEMYIGPSGCMALRQAAPARDKEVLDLGHGTKRFWTWDTGQRGPGLWDEGQKGPELWTVSMP